MVIERMYLTPNRYSRPQTKLERVTKIAIHYVGNPASSAKANRNYFESLKEGKQNSSGNYIYASSHYIIGLDGEVIQCIPENEISYCTNSANPYSISIECCHEDSTGRPNDKIVKSLIELCQKLCKEYKLNPLTDIIRHYDVTGKACHLWYVNHEDEWIDLKKRIANTSVDELDLAVKKLYQKGIINTESAWNKVDNIRLEYVPQLIINYLKYKGIKVCCYTSNLVELYKLGVISDLSSWIGDIKKDNVRWLLIKMSKVV